MPIHPFERAFWMKTYEIQRRSRLAGRVVSSVGAMIEKRPQEICRTIISWAGAVGPTDGCFRDSAAHRFSRKIIQLEVFLRCSMPVENIRFVPNLPSPRFHGSVAIPFPQVLCELKHKFCPFCVIFRRIAPRGSEVLGKVMPVRRRPGRQRLRHKTKLREGARAGFLISIENAIYDCRIVNRPALGVFGVEICGAPFQRTRAVATCQKIVCAKIHGYRAQASQFFQQFLAIRAVGEIRLVVTKISPHSRQHPGSSGRIHVDRQGGPRLFCWYGYVLMAARAWKHEPRNDRCRQKCSPSEAHLIISYPDFWHLTLRKSR